MYMQILFLGEFEAECGENHECVSTCKGKEDGNYQSCLGCNVFATCASGYITDNRPCPANTVWDDHLKECSQTSSTCSKYTILLID